MRFALDKGVELNDLSLEELKQFGPEFDTDFYAAVELNATLDCHDVIGGTARSRVKQALADAATHVAGLSMTRETAHAGA